MEIYDDGENADMVSDNGIYSIIFNDLEDPDYILNIQLNMLNESIIEYQYQINFNQPRIEGVPVIYTEHMLEQSEWSDYEMRVIIDAPGGIEDIEFVKFYVKKKYFTNTGTLINNVCEYEDPIEDTPSNPSPWETFDGWYMDYVTTSTSIYKTTLPMRPIDQCGGYGWIQWKFEVQNKKGFYHILEFEEPVQICNGECE